MEHDPRTIAEYWVRIPVKAVKGGLWIGLIKPYEPIPIDGKVCESELYRRDDKWWLNVTVEREISERTNYQNVIAIDLGIYHIATRIDLATSKTVFYGQSLNQVRGRHFWLRRQLAKKGLQKVIKKIDDHESRITVDMMHKITRDLVNRALETNSLLVVGNLNGLGKKTKKYRKKFNRKLTSFPYYRFSQYLTYKAALAGVRVTKVLTSQICYRCSERGERMKCTSLFICRKCSRENANRNAAFNIAYRALGYISKVGVTVNLPITLTNAVPQEKLEKRLLIYDQ